MKNMKMMIEEYLNAHRDIKRMNLTWGYFIGGFVGIILLGIFYWISSMIGDWIFVKLENIFKIKDHIFIIRWIILFIVRTTLVGIYYFFFKTLLLAILAPFFSYISEKVESNLLGVEYKFTFKENLNFVIRGIKIAGKSFFKEMLATIIVVCLSFIPVINLLVPILIFIIQSYFISFTFVDYTLERQKYDSEKTLDFMKKNKVVFTLGGSIFTMLYFIPIIGVFIAPLLSIVAFTKVTLRLLEK